MTHFIKPIILLVLIGTFNIVNSIETMAQIPWTNSQCDTLFIHGDTENESDATVTSIDPSNNFGSDLNFIASAWTINSAPVTLRAFMKFQLPQLPAGAVINQATLYLKYNPNTTISQGNSYYPGSPYNDVNDAGVYRVIQAWSPNSITWNNQPGFTQLNSVWVPPSTTQTQDLQVNITPLVLDAYAYPNNSFGFVFKLITEAVYRCQVYASGNHPNQSLHPKLVLCYSYTNTGLHETRKLANIQLNNALNGQWQIVNPEQKLLYNIELISMQGQCIKRIPLQNRMVQQSLVSPSDLASGIYLLRLNTEAGMIHTKIHVW
ncbi:MAG: T9SS type A sorting domain-containing protein [Chitinophagaceae bacterium]|nr:T9SS type A sorting domain-containing protein [Chitinophagaceae bacterium]